MKTVAIVVVAVIVIGIGVWVGLGFAFNAGAGPVVSDDRQLAPFSRIDVSGSGTLLLSVGGEPGIRIEARESLIHHLETKVSEDGTLHIGLRGSWWPFGFWRSGPITYHVSVPSLAGVSTSGAVAVRSETSVRGQAFEIVTSGAGSVELQLDVQTLTQHNSGATSVTLAGRADVASYETSGSTTIAASELLSRTASVRSSGSSEVRLAVSDELNVDISGSGTVSYLGNARVSSHITGSGQVNKLQP